MLYILILFTDLVLEVLKFGIRHNCVHCVAYLVSYADCLLFFFVIPITTKNKLNSKINILCAK